MTRGRIRALPACLFALPIGLAGAQDARTITEPIAPPVCKVLVANASEQHGAQIADDTSRIQNAIDDCQPGHAVRLAQGNGRRIFNAGPLLLKSRVALRIDAGVTLFASTDPRAYDRGRHSCGTLDAKGRGCRPFISAEDTEGSGIFGEGAIDGQGGHVIDGKTETWWQLARRAQKEQLRQNVPRLVEINRSREFTLHRITLRNSPNFHVTLTNVDGFTAWGVKIDAPADARNTDGIDPISSRNVTIAHSFIRTGDDNVAIKAGRNGPTENISVLHNHFFNGHGMSIGSETDGGVSRVLVEDLTMDGATSGLRIKSDVSRGGRVADVRYRQVCLINVRAPLDFDTRYDPQATGNRIPQYRDIVLEHVRSMTPGKLILRGFDENNRLAARLDDVVIEGSPAMQAAHSQLILGPGPVRPLPTGEDVHVSGDPSSVPGMNCDRRFVPFPDAALDSTVVRRPQLTTAQAARYSPAEVLKQASAGEDEAVDAWDPLADSLVNAPRLEPDYTVDPAAPADGKKIFNTVQAAVSRAVSDSRTKRPSTRQYILIMPGIYRELLYVPESPAPITLFGTDPDAAKTRISADLHAGTSGAEYVDKFGGQFTAVDPAIAAMHASLKIRPVVGTPGSAIAWIRNNGFQARNITFENAWNRGAVVREVPVEISLQHVQTFNQAVALMVENADKVQFDNVRVLGFQDTLFLTAANPDTAARIFFNKSYIEGDTDFIFGDATAYFYRSEIKSLGAKKSLSYATAPSTSLRRRFGFVFNECRFSHDETSNALAGNFRLARQWFRGQKCSPYGHVTLPPEYQCRYGDTDQYEAPAGTISREVLETVGKVIILNSRIGVHIDRTSPWADWNAAGTIKHRPAQYSSDDFWDNLLKAGIDPIGQMGYTTRRVPPEPFLAEFNNVDE